MASRTVSRQVELRRVVVTGLGCVTPLGNDVSQSWNSLLKGISGVGPITSFPTEGFPVRIAAEVKEFDPTTVLARKEIRHLDRFIHYAVAAASEAVEDSRLDTGRDLGDRAGVIVGSGIGGLQSIERSHETLLRCGPGRISPFFIPQMIVNMASGVISMRFGARGPNSCVVTACATGNHSIGEAFRTLQRGDADIMIAGGSEAPIQPLAIAGFAAMRALSQRNDEPKRASRPFDADRDGFVVGEGAGILVLETLDHALARGAPIHAEIVGLGMSGDAHHMAAPPEGGEGAQRAIRHALEDAGLEPDDVSYINAHGTSTPQGDRVETCAIRAVFGEHADRLLVSSTKAMTGHALGAAGGLEAVFSVLALREGRVPPTINYDTPDPECDLDYVPNDARTVSLKVALSNAFGFGGTNATLAFAHYERSGLHPD
jgi:3-oxoacyl-[acyl-carrier-protein] synthase II